MTGTIVILLIALVWLFVLGPWYINRHRPISKAGTAFDDTRVIHEGGSGALTPRRRPKLGLATQQEDDYDDEQSELDYTEALIAEYPDEAAITEEEYAYEQEFFDSEPEPVIEVTAVEPETSVMGRDDHPYQLNDAYLIPGDLLYSDPDSEPAPSFEQDQYDEELDDELSEEDIAFAAARRGRGGYDPEADRRHATDRYQRRQRTVLTLFVMLAIALGAAVFFGNFVWAAPVVVAVMILMYLSALRGQSRKEAELRHRRIQQLRRARLGVRNSADDELGIPNRLRRPGAVVLEIDDDSPDFLYLEVVDSTELLPASTEVPHRSRGSADAKSLRVS